NHPADPLLEMFELADIVTGEGLVDLRPDLLANDFGAEAGDLVAYLMTRVGGDLVRTDARSCGRQRDRPERGSEPDAAASALGRNGRGRCGPNDVPCCVSDQQLAAGRRDR